MSSLSFLTLKCWLKIEKWCLNKILAMALIVTAICTVINHLCFWFFALSQSCFRFDFIKFIYRHGKFMRLYKNSPPITDRNYRTMQSSWFYLDNISLIFKAHYIVSNIKLTTENVKELRIYAQFLIVLETKTILDSNLKKKIISCDDLFKNSYQKDSSLPLLYNV